MTEIRAYRRAHYKGMIAGYPYLELWYPYMGLGWDLETLGNRGGFTSVQWGLQW